MLTAPEFRALFESAPGLYLALAPDLTIVAVSDAYLRATMTKRAEILGRGIFDVFPDNPAEVDATGVSNLRASLDRVLGLRRPDAMAVQKYDIRRPESEGGGFEERYWSPVNSPVIDAEGDVRYIIHRVEDVTEFVRLTELRSQQQRTTNELRSRAGQMESEILRRAQELQEANRQLRSLQEELESRVQERTAELGNANDALRRSEEQLRQSQKMEAIGRLAGGIAHDFNNLLSVILSCADLAAAELPPEHPVQSDLGEIRHAGQRAADLTRQMLAFSRQQVLEPRSLDLNEIVSNLQKMLARVLGEDIDLKMRLSSRLGTVKADPGQIEQVLMNLVVNARDAMPRGGMLTVETSNVFLDEVYARQHLDVEPGPYVLLAVSDTGIGMDKETQARIFEPFFTTKERGKGTGLGLATVFGIVKQSGGNIWLYSEPGGGTTFKIYLPRTEGAPENMSRTLPHRDTRGTETILLAEDEVQVRVTARTILERAGYHVLEARSPAEAIAISDHAEVIDLLLTDVIMPKISGRELAERITIKRPAIKTLFMSGYTDDAIVLHGVLEAGVFFLQKPFTPDSLVHKVRDVLDAQSKP